MSEGEIYYIVERAYPDGFDDGINACIDWFVKLGIINDELAKTIMFVNREAPDPEYIFNPSLPTECIEKITKNLVKKFKIGE